MADEKLIKPVDGRLVPDPYRHDALPAEGRKVELNQYWLRRVAEGDVIIVEENERQRGKSVKH